MACHGGEWQGDLGEAQREKTGWPARARPGLRRSSAWLCHHRCPAALGLRSPEAARSGRRRLPRGAYSSSGVIKQAGRRALRNSPHTPVNNSTKRCCMYPPIKYNNTQARVAPLRTAGADKTSLSEDIRTDAMRLGSKTNTPEAAASQRSSISNSRNRRRASSPAHRKRFKNGFNESKHVSLIARWLFVWSSRADH